MLCYIFLYYFIDYWTTDVYVTFGRSKTVDSRHWIDDHLDSGHWHMDGHLHHSKELWYWCQEFLGKYFFVLVMDHFVRFKFLSPLVLIKLYLYSLVYSYSCYLCVLVLVLVKSRVLVLAFLELIVLVLILVLAVLKVQCICITTKPIYFSY